jgi:hypothetical protein
MPRGTVRLYAVRELQCSAAYPAIGVKKQHDLEFRLEVDLVVVRRAVARHQDDGRLHGIGGPLTRTGCPLVVAREVAGDVAPLDDMARNLLPRRVERRVRPPEQPCRDLFVRARRRIGHCGEAPCYA